MAPKQAPGGRPHSGEGSVTHRRQPLKSQKSLEKEKGIPARAVPGDPRVRSQQGRIPVAGAGHRTAGRDDLPKRFPGYGGAQRAGPKITYLEELNPPLSARV